MSLPRVCLCRGLMRLALGKDTLCRVSEIWPSAKPQALGKERVFSCAYTLMTYIMGNYTYFHGYNIQISQKWNLTLLGTLYSSVVW